MRRTAWMLALCGALMPVMASAEPSTPQGMPVLPDAPSPTLPAARSAGPDALTSTVRVEAAAPVCRCRLLEESTVRTIRDSGGARVALRIPAALDRPANVFRLYGARPLTLWQRSRRRDLYRDAFLELATRAAITPKTAAWDSLPKQWDWLRSQAPSFSLPGAAGAGLSGSPLKGRDAAELLQSVRDSVARLRSAPGYQNLAAAAKLLGQPELEISEPVSEGLQLRALATDQAEARLRRLGNALRTEAPGGDPALRDGYRAARAEFAQVRQGLWPAVTASLKRNQGRLIASAVKELVLSRLGFWALFGYMGWQGAEGALNTEYRGQYAVALATLGGGLAESVGSGPEVAPEALYADFATNYQLTEALKAGSVLEWKPAGGLNAGSWQVRCTGRCEEIRAALK